MTKKEESNNESVRGEGDEKRFYVPFGYTRLPSTSLLSLCDVIVLYCEVPKVPVFLVEIPYVHGVVIGYQLVASSSLHVVYLGLEVVWLTRLVHLDNAKYHCEYSCTDVEVFPLRVWCERSIYQNNTETVEQKNVIRQCSINVVCDIVYRNVKVHPSSNCRKK